ncbi:prepilin-type N-terminal cleavage/methylation domain-containing protein [Candidatus Methylomirabilis sp.]|uniref:PilW family protein n=1 Tax=Candidatus Methylomirabilis sp. TaxID=2032687 RepID=UPI002A6037CF|nr:prepilin-type N-terminal cleavage/methylation domain-containing protein [Candidatus Methylomirabilis sp.]
MKRVPETEGYSLVELLIVLAIAGLIGGAILGVYQVSQGIYTRATALEDAQLGARAGLDRMANELRLIGSYWVGANGAGNAITAASPASITFMANVDDSSVINGVEATATAFTANTVSLSLSATATADAFKIYADPNSGLNDYIYIADGGTRDVRQITGIGGSTLTIASPLSSAYPVGSLVRDVKTITYTRNAGANTLTRRQGGANADTIIDNVTNLTFTYFSADGVTQTADAALIREIRIDLTVQSPDGSARRMTTRVKPRSLP